MDYYVLRVNFTGVTRLVPSFYPDLGIFKLHIRPKLVLNFHSSLGTFNLHIQSLNLSRVLTQVQVLLYCACGSLKLSRVLVQAAILLNCTLRSPKLYYCIIMVHPPTYHHPHLHHIAHARLTRIGMQRCTTLTLLAASAYIASSVWYVLHPCCHARPCCMPLHCHVACYTHPTLLQHNPTIIEEDEKARRMGN